MDRDTYRTFYELYTQHGLNAIRCKGKHENYNALADYKVSKEPVDKGFTKSNYEGLTFDETYQWQEQGGYIGWLLPDNVIAIDVEGAYSISYLTKLWADLSPLIHYSPNGVHAFFSSKKELPAASRVFTRCGAEVTYRVGRKNYIILAPAEGRSWKTDTVWRLPEFPDYLLPYDRSDKVQVLRCLAFQIGKAHAAGLLNGYEDIDLALVGSLVTKGISKEETMDILRIVFQESFDAKRSEYIYNNALERINADKPILGLGTLIQRLKDKGLSLSLRFVQELNSDAKNSADSSGNQSSIIVMLLFSRPIFRDQVGLPHIFLEGECYQLDSKKVRDWLNYKYFLINNEIAKSSDINGAIAIASGRASQMPPTKLYNRIARIEDKIYYDLGDSRCVEISKEGWKTIQSPMLFYRFAHQEVQVEPMPGGNLADIFRFINVVNEDDKILLVILLITYFIPDIPLPVLYLGGGQGGGKSFCFRVLKSLVDPSKTPILPISKDEKELFLQLFKHRLILFDNVNALSDSASDLLSQATTGIGVSKRMLYTDSDEVIYQIKRGIGLNGINITGLNPDLLDRCILIELERILPHNRISEEQFFRDFDAAKPYMLGAIFDILCKAMAVYEEGVMVEMGHRLMDFTMWGTAISSVWNIGTKFAMVMQRNLMRQNDEVVVSNFLMQAVLQFMSDKVTYSNYVAQTYIEIKNAIGDIGKDPTFPKHPNRLRKALAKIKANLQDYGITYDFDTTNTTKGVLININNLYPTNPPYNYLEELSGLLTKQSRSLR